ncbi:WRN-like protein [Mya arenaria]|uniref:3'-5' exonuclease n=1 Tax=Mya arenaria TaxID=6604 RepID=A0ABY7EFW6_MYAAR|nr:bifunctional 3'-5' exonuclease/ATP-dependent helicase WRN-like [Mya arenaria]WAR07681.1 WRN-like protein [Mya arenaria]
MASRRKRALPPWLQGTSVKKKTLEENICSNEEAVTKSDTQIERSVDAKKTSDKQVERSFNAKKTSEEQGKVEWTAEEAVAMSYKEFLFQGCIIYSYDINDCNILCEEIIISIGTDNSNDVFIGFDSEWPVTYEKGAQAKTALVQLCLNTEKCYLFHLSCMSKFPSMLKKLIEMENVKKVGLNVEYDIWKLGTDFDIKSKEVVQKSTVELRTLANKKLRSSENWSLEGLTRNVLHRRISKDPSVRKCDWRQFPLPETQQRYAATDAVVSLLLYQHLIKK